MENNVLDQDALATEEMLKMFEGVDIDKEFPIADEDTFEEADVHNDDDNHVNEDVHTLAEHESSDHTSSTLDMDALLADQATMSESSEHESLDMLEDPLAEIHDAQDTDTLETAAIDDDYNTDYTAPTNDIDENNIGESEQYIDSYPADISADTGVDHVETTADEEMPATLVTSEIESPVDHQDTNTVVATQADNNNTLTNHLQAVVNNAIQALQDWLTLRQESEHKSSPQQSIAQLNALLDTVTNQQQQLAEQLANSQQQTIQQLCQQLGAPVVTAESLGWQADEWQTKAQSLADKTQDISRLNAQIRKELSLL